MTLTQAAAAAPTTRKQSGDEIADMSAGEIARRIATRALRATDALEHFIARLQSVNLLFATLSGDGALSFRRMLKGNRIDRRVRPLLLSAGMPAWLRGVAGIALDTLGQPRSARNQRRIADRRASDRAAMARPCRARGHGRDRDGGEETSGLSR
jgi:hypothetical protein